MLQRVYRNRADFYNCSSDLFSAAGVRFIPEKKLSNALTFPRVGSHLFLRYDPKFDIPEHDIEELDHSKIKCVMRLLEDHFKDQGLSWNDPYIYHYKFDSDLPALPSYDLDIQEFRESELVELTTYYSECSEDDLEQADIYVDQPDPVIFLGRIDQKIVAYGSHRYVSQGIADMGILVHPGFRKKGYGLAKVHHNTAWCIEHEVIPMYIVNRRNTGSMSLIEKLKFTPIIEAYRLD